MFTIRNVGGISLLLAGSTWLWLTPAFAGRGVSTTSVMWAITRVLCLLTITVFCVATWGMFARRDWWEALAVASAVLGLVTLIPYWVAAHNGGEPLGNVTWNSFVHVLIVAGVLALLLVPQLEHWVSQHVMRA
jgi:hypothetical protein